MATLFKFSEAASLALHAMVLIAVKDGEVVKAREMSAAFKASDAHMSKVCQRLTRSGLLQAHRGVTGGFTLSRGASRIRLYEIYEAIEGKVVLSPCLFRNRSCGGKPKHDCVFGKRIMSYEEDFLRYLKQTKLSTVAATSDLGAL